MFELAVLVGLLHLAGYVVYYRASKKEVTPNITSWAIWTFGSIVNLLSYKELVNGWGLKTVLPLVCSLCCIALFISFVRRGRFKRPSKVDVLIFVADIVAIIIWSETDALVGNIAVQISTFISFIPILRDTYADPDMEAPAAWTIWTVAYGMDIILCVADWNGWGELAYPINCMILHAVMAILAKRRRS